MTALPKGRPISVQEYIANESVATTRSEYYFGEVLAMSGASYNHVTIVSNLTLALGNQLRNGPCRVRTSELLTEVQAGSFYAYPDVIVVCGKPEFVENKFDTLKNPRIVFEILSPSTERFDRGAKSAGYREIPSLTDYVLVWQKQPRIEHYHRTETGTWELRDAIGIDAKLTLLSVKCELPLCEVYEDVEYP